jgi:hypothetical protein
MIVAAISTAGGLGLFLLLGTQLLGLAPNTGLRLPPLLRRRSRRSRVAGEPATGPLPATAIVLPPDEVLDPATSTARRAPVRFTKPAARGVERCRVASRLVPLRSEPGELTGVLLGRLDVGDEVDVLRQRATYCFVRTPSGAEGWAPGLALTSAVVTLLVIPPTPATAETPPEATVAEPATAETLLEAPVAEPATAKMPPEATVAEPASAGAPFEVPPRAATRSRTASGGTRRPDKRHRSGRGGLDDPR